MTPYKPLFKKISLYEKYLDNLKKNNQFLEMATISRFSNNGYYFIRVVGREGVVPHFHLTDGKSFYLKIKIPSKIPESYNEFEYLNYDKMKKHLPKNIKDILKYVVDLLPQKPENKAYKEFPNYLEAIRREWDVNNPEYAKYGYKPY